MAKCKCPIPGCDFEFSYGILGWDSHISRLDNHPDYHPKTVTPEARKRVFTKEFMTFFDHAKTADRRSTRPPPKESGLMQRVTADTKEVKPEVRKKKSA